MVESEQPEVGVIIVAAGKVSGCPARIKSLRR